MSSTEEFVKEFQNRQRSFDGEEDLNTIKQLYLNKDYIYATYEEIRVVKETYNLLVSGNIYLNEKIIYKCYLEVRLSPKISLNPQNLTSSYLYNRIIKTYKKLFINPFPPTPPTPTPTPTKKLSEFEEFEEICINDLPNRKKKFYELSQKYRYDESKLKQINNIKNKYW